MKDNVRQELKELCYFIIENNNALARPEQLTRVQMLYERLLVLNYLEEVEAEKKAEQKERFSPPKPKAQSPQRPISPIETPTASIPKPEEIVREKPIEAAKDPEDQPEKLEPLSPEKPEIPAEDIVQNKTIEPAAEKVESGQDPGGNYAIPPESKTENTEDRRDLNDEHQPRKSINDQLAKGAIQVGLNDRIAFVQHLFNDSQADFNRVLSQLNTLDTYLESMYFIENLVKPDYEWENKKPYEERLINLVKKRFGEDW